MTKDAEPCGTSEERFEATGPFETVIPTAPARKAVGPFFVLDGRGKESDAATRVQLSHDKEGLHIAFSCPEPNPGCARAEAAEDGRSVFRDDHVQICLRARQRDAPYCTVGVNRRGRKAFGRVPGRPAGAWHEEARFILEFVAPAAIQADARPVDGGWQASVSIPWKELGTEPAPGLELAANFCRLRYLADGVPENSSWPAIQGGSFMDPERWGSVILGVGKTRRRGARMRGRPSTPPPAIPDPADAEPAFAMRAYHTAAPRQAEVEEYKTLVAALARLRFNTLMIEVDACLGYERRPELAARGALSKAQMRELVAYCAALGFEVIPQVQTFGHFGYVLQHERYRRLSENDTPHPRWKFYNYCPSNPDTYKLVFDLFEEVIEVFKPRRFHIGHDEITYTPIGVCPRCKGVPPHALLAREVRTLHDWLKARGIETLMWGDQLLTRETASSSYNGGPPFDTAKAVAAIPRDVVICDWHYDSGEDFRSLAFFKEQGFPVIACGWFELGNVVNFTRAALRAGAEGYCMTTWTGIGGMTAKARLTAAIPIAAQYAWAPHRFELPAVPWHPVRAFRALCRAPRPERDYRLIGLSGHAKTRLKDLGLEAIGADPVFVEGVPFKTAGKAVALDAATPRAWQIPIGGRVAALHFLHGCTPRERLTDGLYDGWRLRPATVGHYVVHYEDGVTERLNLVQELDIADWNSRFGAGRCDLLQTTRRDGALVSIGAREWRNPRPDKAVTAVDMVRTSAGTDLFLLAITLSELTEADYRAIRKAFGKASGNPLAGRQRR
ncbi:MAG: family 20 glycosylhydrolase [Kiritimatiellae bacterium]|nr:family 20 glycosylhydrolase [Kiritimatiellia bacterium]